MHFPLSIDLKGKNCTVVGGGIVAQRKVDTLVDFEANVTVIAPDVTPNIARMVDEELIRHIPRDYQPGDLTDEFLVIAATDERETNSAVSQDAVAAGSLVNVVDSPDECSFFMPSILRRDDLVIGISTGGKSPAFAKHVREYLEETIGPEYGEYLRLAERLRSELRSKANGSGKPADKVYKTFFDSEILDLLRVGERDAAAKRMEACM